LPGLPNCSPANGDQTVSSCDHVTRVDHFRIELRWAIRCIPIAPSRRRTTTPFARQYAWPRNSGIDTVINFSGCPGDHARAKYPNWVTCPWPPDYLEILNWQWTRVAFPYWARMAGFARKYGVKKIALEMHPGFVVYNPRPS